MCAEKLSDKILIVGLGSPIMSDDAIGLKVIDEIDKLNLTGVQTQQEAIGGLDIIPVISGYRYAIIVDAIQTHSYGPGTVMIFNPEDFEHTVGNNSAHEVNLSTAMHIGRQLDPDSMPLSVRFVAIEVEDLQTVSETMTQAVQAALPNAVDAVLHLIEELRSL